MRTFIAVYLATDVFREDLRDNANNNITAGWYIYQFPLQSEPLCGPYFTKEEAENDFIERTTIAFVKETFPSLIKQDEKGFYWANLDDDRFYFKTYEAAALDVAQDMGISNEEFCNGKHLTAL